METGRQTKEIESGLFVEHEIQLPNSAILIVITSKHIEIKYKGRTINRFGYSGEIQKSIISDLSRIFVDLKEFKGIKEARTWIVDNKLFSKINSEKKILDIKINDLQKRFNIEESIMVFNDDYVSMAEKFWDMQPFYYDKSNIWWLWNFQDKYWEMVDEIDLINTLKDKASPFMKLTNSGTFAQIMKAMQMVGRRKKPMDAPKKWIQFKDKAFSLKSKKIYDITPNFFFTNPLPWKIGENSETPTIDKLFHEWVGDKYQKTLYEIMAYCCYSDYPIQVLFCLYGGGRNGKSCFLKVLAKFIGKINLCSTDLDLLVGRNKSRFEIFKMYKKLACLLGETNFGVLESSAILKKLTGSDLIGFEVKGKLPFDEYNYAKILIASNSLPSSDDTSEGFYRRWVIIDFPNQFNEGKDITETIPDYEYEALASKVCNIIPELLERGSFTNQGTIEERKDKYVMASNPLPAFIEHFCVHSPDFYVRYSALYTNYTKFLTQNKRRIVSKKEFSKRLTEEGLESRKTSKEGIIDYYVEGMKFKEVLPDFLDFSNMYTHPMRAYGELPNNGNQGNEGNDEPIKESEPIFETIHSNCHICGSTPCCTYDKPNGKPICKECLKQKETQGKL